MKRNDDDEEVAEPEEVLRHTDRYYVYYHYTVNSEIRSRPVRGRTVKALV